MKFILILMIVTCGAAMPVYAAQSLTLVDAISMALKNSNQAKAAGFSNDASKLGVSQAESRYYPAISFEETLSASNSPTSTFMMKLDEGRFAQNDFQIHNLNNPGVWHDFKTSLTIQQPLYMPTLASARRSAGLEADRSRHELESLREEIGFRVFELYLDVQRSAARYGAAEKGLTDARENMRLAVLKVAAGVGLRSDELRARTHQSVIEQQIISARNNFQLAKMRLALAIGLPMDSPLELGDPLDRVAVPQNTGENALTALERRQDLKQAQSELAKSDEGVTMAGAAYLPVVAAFASYQLNAKDTPFGADNDAWMAGITLKWELFDGFRRSSDKGRAAAERAARAELLEKKNRDILFQVREGYMRRDEMGKRLEVARHAVLDAEETVRILGKRFENSLATMLELLDAQEALNQARANLIDSEVSYAQAGGYVHYVSGTFLKEMVK